MAARTSLHGVIRHRVVHPLQAAGAYLAFTVLRLIPLAWASAVGGWLGRTFGPYLGITSRARRNLSLAFPEKTKSEIEAIIAAMWDNLGRTAFEYPHLDRLRFYDDGGDVEVLNPEHIDALKNDGKAGIFFSAHLANWEVAALGAVRRGLPIHLIYRAPNNPWVDRLFHHRLPGDSEMIPKGSIGAKRAIKMLTSGEHLGMLVDQKMNDGIAVPFFGRDAMTAPALALFALKYDCPVVPARVERLKGARFRITVFPPLEIVRTGDIHSDILANMTRVNAMIESWIREKPEQWLWLHNRWPE
ncbi:MAG: lipid A biosynthesis lauroyl acyltransferase [Rhodospirillales bacterium]|nr:lipid A biosynthesis lauroyl acyltransferase [Rhodospirillales bacterium]